MRLWVAALVLIGLAVAVAGAFAWRSAARPEAELGLFTTLPIMMGESADIAEALGNPAEPHWSRAALESRFRLVSMDALRPGGTLRLLLVAQPRPLAPEENVALDDWVRGGGRLLLLADPLATFESRFAIGDPRRPQDTVLLSPILARWGLQLRFDEDSAPGVREIAGIPVNLPGTLGAMPGGFDSACRFEGQGVLAECRVGQGRVTILADAAVLDDPASRRAFDRLLDRAFVQ